MKNGFTLVEVMIVMGMVATLAGFAIVRVTQVARRAPLTATVEVLISDLRGQQSKAMTGVSAASYGIALSDISLPENITISTTFGGSIINFTKGSGDVVGFSPGNNTITLTQTLTAETKTITINRYGAVTSVE